MPIALPESGICNEICFSLWSRGLPRIMKRQSRSQSLCIIMTPRTHASCVFCKIMTRNDCIVISTTDWNLAKQIHPGFFDVFSVNAISCFETQHPLHPHQRTISSFNNSCINETPQQRSRNTHAQYRGFAKRACRNKSQCWQNLMGSIPLIRAYSVLERLAKYRTTTTNVDYLGRLCMNISDNHGRFFALQGCRNSRCVANPLMRHPVLWLRSSVRRLPGPRVQYCPEPTYLPAQHSPKNLVRNLPPGRCIFHFVDIQCLSEHSWKIEF